jgi:hypothetical protein
MTMLTHEEAQAVAVAINEGQAARVRRGEAPDAVAEAVYDGLQEQLLEAEAVVVE